jgi:2-hydroxyacyl-CoA lyase
MARAMTVSWKPPAFAGAGPGGKGFFVEDPKNIRGALDEAMNFRGPALVNIVLSQGSARKPQQFRWHS